MTRWKDRFEEPDYNRNPDKPMTNPEVKGVVRIYMADVPLPESYQQAIRKALRGYSVLFIDRPMQMKQYWFKTRKSKGLQLFEDEHFEPCLYKAAEIDISEAPDLFPVSYEMLLETMGMEGQELKRYTAVTRNEDGYEGIFLPEENKRKKSPIPS